MSSPSDERTGAAPAGASSAATPQAQDRRRNLALRALIDEMLFQVRGMQRENAAWSDDERTQAEAELDRIMRRVRSAATTQESPDESA